MVCREYTYAYGAVSITDGKWDSLILPKADTVCMRIFLDETAVRYPADRIVMVLDGAGRHRGGRLGSAGKYQAACFAALFPGIEPGGKYMGRASV
jgi:hypothetical protein